MSDTDLIPLDLPSHLIECPHCEKETVHHSAGPMILFSPAKCVNCGRDFVIAMNQPHQ
jgi:hypothetical protein